MPYVSSDLVAVYHAMLGRLDAIEAGQHALRQLLEGHHQGLATGTEAALVQAVFAVAGGREFTAQELIDMAHRPGEPERALRILMGMARLRSARAAGKALAAAAGRPCADTGLVLQRIDRGGRACLWLVSNQPKPASR